MPEDRNDPVVRLPPDQLAALGQALREGAVRTPPGSNPSTDVLTGADGGALRRMVVLIIDDELSRRRVLSDTEIRSIAKDVAHSVFREMSEPLASDVRKHLTEEQIEKVVFDILTDIGLPADTKEERKGTKQILEALFRGRELRSRIGGSLIDETAKALIGQAFAGGVLVALGTAIWKTFFSGGSHP